VNLDDLVNTTGSWWSGQGNQSDIVVSVRARLARNLADFPFIRRCSDADRDAICRQVRSVGEKLTDPCRFSFLDIAPMSALDRQFLMERQWISRELSEGTGARGLLAGSDDRYSVMINEEDHIRLQVLLPGLQLEEAWEHAKTLDQQLETQLRFAFHPDFGYLTACPTNAGTGLRLSVMMHLPALVITKQMEKVFRSMQKISIAVRGFFGEGSQFMGDFYQISNQVTLGQTEEELIGRVQEIIPRLLEYERMARDFLVREHAQDLGDQISRGLGILKTAKKITSEEAMDHLSKVRLGISLGWIDPVPIATVHRLIIQTQPAHLQKRHGGTMTPSERNIERARWLQSEFSHPGDSHRSGPEAAS